MLLFMQKKTDDPDKAERLPDERVPLSDYIPCHGHFDAETLLTKNGELMQTIHIGGKNGHDYENGGDTNVRDMLRAAIAAHVNDDRLAIWIHTVRRRIPIHHHPHFKEGFAADLHKQWERLHPWQYQYKNDIYLTLLHEGQDTPLFDRKTLPHVFLPGRNRRHRNAYLEDAHQRLSSVTANVLQALKAHYDAHTLSLEERADNGRPVVYSQPMEFLNYLVNLRESPRPLPPADLSAALSNHAITFGFNALEAKSADGKRRFAALLTLKQYREMPAATVDRLMQMPMEFIVSQAFHFVPASKALQPYREQKHWFDLSGDADSVHACGIDDMLRADRGRITDFGEQQTNLMIMGDDFKALDSEAAGVQSTFAEIGLVAIREDVRLEECFWAQLPGNFEFLRRRDAIPTAKIGGFCTLNRFPIGTEQGNHWGGALTLLPSTTGAPCFFNFHRHDNGHTAFLDFNAFHDQSGGALLNFFLSEARRYDGRLYLFDRDRSAELFMSKLSAEYRAEPPSLNPFAAEDTPRQRAFLLAWCAALLSTVAPLTDAQKSLLQQAIADVYACPPAERNLHTFALRLAEADVTLATRLAPWHGSGRLAGLIDGTDDSIDMRHSLYGFDMTSIVAQPESIVPVFSCLMQRIVTALDGRPTIIVLHEAWDLIENEFFAPRLESLMEMLKEHNALVIFATGKPLGCFDAQTFSIVMQGCGSHLYVPDEVQPDYAAFGLTPGDIGLLSRMQRQRGDFLLRQHGESIALQADTLSLAGHAVLAGDSKNLSGSAGGG